MSQTSRCERLVKKYSVKSAVARGSLFAAWALACGTGGDGASAPTDPAVEPQPRSPRSQENVAVPAVPRETQPAAASTPGTSPPVTEPVPEPARNCDDSVSLDELYAAIEADLRREDEDAPFFRYVSLSNRLNQGICPEDLAADRLALFKAVNSLSTETSIVLPQAVDADSVVYRIDLRDLGWDQPTSVGGVAFIDKWEAIIAASPYAIELDGDDADSAKFSAVTTVPVLFSDALIDATVVGDLYYALVGIPNSVFELFPQLGIDLATLEAEDVVRAGTSQSQMSQQDTIIQRLDQGIFQGFYWSRFDVSDTAAGQSIFADPLNFRGEVGASMFTLPNGMLAFALFDAAGLRVADTDVLVDRSQRDGRMQNSVSCSGCHFAGVNSVIDEVRTFVVSNSRQFDADTFEEVEETFLPQPALNEVIRVDNETYQAALERAGLDTATGDPVSAAFRRFDSEVTLAVAAGELGLTPDALGSDLVAVSNEADPLLATLAEASLRREQFEATYLATLCSVLISSENRPLDATCDAALE